MRDFRECLDDLEEQVADFTEEVQQLAGCTSETISLEVNYTSPMQSEHVPQLAHMQRAL